MNIKDGKVIVVVDGDKDGKPAVKMTLDMSEALQEVMAKLAKNSEKVELKAMVTFEMEGSNAVIKVDTDTDGEAFLQLELDLIESVDEVIN